MLSMLTPFHSEVLMDLHVFTHLLELQLTNKLYEDSKFYFIIVNRFMELCIDTKWPYLFL